MLDSFKALKRAYLINNLKYANDHIGRHFYLRSEMIVCIPHEHDLKFLSKLNQLT